MTEDATAALKAEATWLDLWHAGVLKRFVVLGFGVWLHASNASLVSTLIPSAVLDIGGVSLISWASVLYQVGSIVAGAAAGLMAVRYSLRGAMMAAAGFFALGCAVCALAPDMPSLLAGRLVKGAGGGALVALTHVAIVEMFPNRIMPRLIAMVSAVWGTAAFCGPAVGGAFAEFGAWRLGFWAFAGQAILYLAAVGWMLRGQDTRVTSHGGRFPMVRLLLLSASIMSIAYAGILGFSWMAAMLVVIGLGLLGAFFVRDRSAGESRLYPRAAFDPNKPTLWGLFMIGIFFVGTITFTVYGPIMIQLLHDARPITGGVLVALESISWTMAALIFAGVGVALHARLIRIGACLLVASVIGFALVMPTGPVWALAPLLMAAGAGFGISFGFVTQRIVAGAAADDRARASSAIPTTQMIGYAMGAAACGIIANGLGFSREASSEVLETAAFWSFAAFLPAILAGAFAAMKLAGPIGERAVEAARAEG